MNKIILMVIIFFLIGGYIIKTTYDINFKDKEDIKIFSKEFAKWLFHVGKNTAEVTAHVVKEVANKTWLPSFNESNKTKND